MAAALRFQSGGTVRRSVLSPGVTIREGAVVEDCVLMDGVDVRSGAVVRRAIVDKNVVVPPGVQLGVDRERDGRRFQLSGRGIVAIGKGQPIRPDE